jgi:hypothetical protein
MLYGAMLAALFFDNGRRRGMAYGHLANPWGLQKNQREGMGGEFSERS